MLVERNNKLVGGVEVLPSEAGRVSLGKVLGRQGEEGNLTLLSVTVTMLNPALLAGGLVDRIHLFAALSSLLLRQFESLPVGA
ncbi:MAG: hypothetical protein ABSE51_24310 [Terracidiphilus sp.]|jgi:hypothetical protein